LNEHDLEIIKTLYEQKNITKSAKLLYISQPALTRRIKLIESSIGTPLIYRGNKGITFTPAGEYAAKFAVKTLQETQKFREKISNMGDETTGILRVAAPDIICKYYLPRLLGKFRELHPNVRFEVTIAQSSDIIGLMNSKGLHFGFLRNNFGRNESERLLLTKNYICAVANHPFKLEELPTMVRVDYVTDTYYREILDNWWNDTFSVPPIIGMEVSKLDLCKEMVFNGLGYGLLPSFLLNGRNDMYKIFLCNKKGEKIERKTWLVHKKDVFNMKLARTFYEFMQNCDFASFQIHN